MKYFIALVVLLSSLTGCSESQNNQGESTSLLIFSHTEGFRHASIPTGIAAIKEIAATHNLGTHHTEDAAFFHPDSLDRFEAVIFLNTTGNIFNPPQQAAFQQFIRNGGGFVGIHSATDTEYNWAWYGNMIGAYFDSHPTIQEATVSVTNRDHPSTSFLPDEWVRTDEWYNFRNISSDITVLMNLEESSYEGGKNGTSHPIAWYHEFDGGRIFYTGMGHTAESYSDSLFQKHLWGGIKYVLNKD